MKNPESINKRLLGRRANLQGIIYEKIFDFSCRHQGIKCVRIPDGCKQLRSRIIRVKSPFDWILSFQDQIAFIDTKSTAANAVSFSSLPEHQVIAMHNLSSKQAKAGFVVFFLKHETCAFFDVKNLARGSSMSFDQGIQLGDNRRPDLTRIFNKELNA